MADWPRRYGLEPWLVETLVDPSRHHGGSYRAANWVALGATTGRGRMDRYGRRAGEAPKTVLVYPFGPGCEAAASGGLSHASCSPPRRGMRRVAVRGGGDGLCGGQGLSLFARGPTDE